MTHRRCSFDSQPCPFDRSDPPLRLARHSQPHSHTMARSAAATSLLSQVLVVLLLLAVAEPFLSPVSGSNICICECCDGSSCLRDSNATFAIGSCNDCTLDLCTDKYVDCNRVPNVNAKCINRDSGWNKATIIIFLITLAALIVLGCARNHSPALQKLISSGNTNH